MSRISRPSHASQRGPRAPRTLRARRHGRSSVTAIAVTTVIAVLVVAVAVLSYRAAQPDEVIVDNRISSLEIRIGELEGQLTGIRQTAATAARQARTSLVTAKKARRPASAQAALATCLAQVQREIDDLQAYLAYRTPPRRDRVAGSCARLLKPRFAR